MKAMINFFKRLFGFSAKPYQDTKPIGAERL